MKSKINSARIFAVRNGSALAVAALLLCASAGCVQRRMTVRSNPPGAFVYIDNYPIGVTPVSTDFVYYGKRQFRLVRDGYETLTIDQRVRTPWYEWFGLDFVSENLIPYNIRDEQTLSFQLVPQQVPPREQLTARAEELRASTQAQRQMPMMAPTAPPLVAPPPPLPPGAIVPPAGQPYVLPQPNAFPPAGMAPPTGSGTRIPPPATGQPAYAVPPINAAPPGVGVPGAASGSMYAPVPNYQAPYQAGSPASSYPAGPPGANYSPPPDARYAAPAGSNYPTFPPATNYAAPPATIDSAPPQGYAPPVQGAPGTTYPGAGMPPSNL